MQRFLFTVSVKNSNNGVLQILTLNVSNALLQDLLKDLGILELFLDLGNDAL
jgi:hypothetical protein